MEQNKKPEKVNLKDKVAMVIDKKRRKGLLNDLICKTCNGAFYVGPYKRKIGSGIYCSKECRGKDNTGNKHPLWNGGPVKKACPVCKKEFSILKSRYIKGEGTYCSKKCQSSTRTGTSNPMWKEKLEKVCKICKNSFSVNPCHKNKEYCSKKCSLSDRIGNNNGNWKGGKCRLSLLIRSSKRYESWRNSIYKRDSYICTKCGYSHGKILNAHHLFTLSKIIKENKLKTMEEAAACSILWDINNGITVCEPCHTNLHKTIKNG